MKNVIRTRLAASLALLALLAPGAALAAQGASQVPLALEPPTLADDTWQRCELSGQSLSLALPPGAQAYGDALPFHYYLGAGPATPELTVLAGDALADTDHASDPLSSFRKKLVERLAGPDWKIGLTMFLRACLDDLKIKNRGGLYFFEREGFYVVFLRSDQVKNRVAVLALAYDIEDKKVTELILGIPANDKAGLDRALAILSSIRRSP
jgi:hypothetical protein